MVTGAGYKAGRLFPWFYSGWRDISSQVGRDTFIFINLIIWIMAEMMSFLWSPLQQLTHKQVLQEEQKFPIQLFVCLLALVCFSRKIQSQIWSQTKAGPQSFFGSNPSLPYTFLEKLKRISTIIQNIHSYELKGEYIVSSPKMIWWIGLFQYHFMFLYIKTVPFRTLCIFKVYKRNFKMYF